VPQRARRRQRVVDVGHRQHARARGVVPPRARDGPRPPSNLTTCGPAADEREHRGDVLPEACKTTASISRALTVILSWAVSTGAFWSPRPIVGRAVWPQLVVDAPPLPRGPAFPMGYGRVMRTRPRAPLEEATMKRSTICGLAFVAALHLAPGSECRRSEPRLGRLRV
jgi:hypothetical protein